MGILANQDAATREFKWLSRLAEGASVDLRAPYFSKEPRKSIVKGLEAQIGRLIKSDEILGLVFHYLESPEMEKIGPQSTAKPWNEWGPDLAQNLYQDTPFPGPDINSRALERSVEHVQSLVKVDSIRMTSAQQAIGQRVNGSVESMEAEGMDGTTNSGFPYLIGHWKPGLDESDPEKLEAFRWLMSKRVPSVNEALSQGKVVELSAIASTRMTQKGADGPAMRLVDAIEKVEPICWKRFTPDLIAALRETMQFCALNDTPYIDLTMQTILETAGREGRTVIGGDYSNYDQSLPSEFIALGGQIIANWVRGGRTYVNALVRSMINSRLVTPTKIWPIAPGGMRSGSGGTNLLDSVCNLIVIYYGQEAGYWKVVSAAVQGDDFVLDGPGVTPEAVAEVASLFGLSAHPEKQFSVGGSLSFLKRLHIEGKLGGIASVMRTLGSILSYERLGVRPKDWNSEVNDTIRARAQLQNACFSPFFETLVQYVSSGDRFHLGKGKTLRQLLKSAGDTATSTLRDSLSGQVQLLGGALDTSSLDKAVVRVLDGKRMPPWGSRQRFLDAYGDRASHAVPRKMA
uniref:Putative replicase n=1 Tax=Nitsystermes virus TaxID=2796619 RepID=A0A7T7GUZ7_9VIRU|nr:putative replicase [Nitsystermes virus]